MILIFQVYIHLKVYCSVGFKESALEFWQQISKSKQRGFTN